MLLREGDAVTSPRGTYRVQARIGSESSFGAIFKALDGAGIPVVVKQLLGKARIEADSGMDYDYVRRTFEREARILLNHGNSAIVQAFDFFEQEGDLFLVMEFINGEDLDQALIRRMDKEGKPFSEEEVVPIGIALCGVLHALHQLPGQVLYRDLKPRNVMWDAKERRIRLIDFGTARFMSRGAQATKALGTPGYAPPELYTTQQPLSFASDVYTIGATLFELVTGEVPDALWTPDHFHGFEASLSERFQDIIRHAMAQDPAQRYPTAEAMGQDLARLPAAGSQVRMDAVMTNPYPYLSCRCLTCGTRPKSGRALYCSECGNPYQVLMLRVRRPNAAADGTQEPVMDLFLEKDENLIGRQDIEENQFPDIDLSRFDPGCHVSRHHCRLVLEEARCYLETCNTTNPTRIDGRTVKPGRRTEIAPGTELELAELRVVLTTKPILD